MIEHNGADVLVAHLLTTGVISLPGTNRPWPAYLNTMPENPDEVVNVNDTTGVMDGRSMRTKKVIEHPGVQFLTRGKTYRRAVAQGFKINQQIELVYNVIVTLKDENNQNKQYLIHSVKRTTSLIGVGKEEGGSRELVSSNFTITYGEYP